MGLEKLFEMADEYIGFSCKPKSPKYKAGHVFDEDKSVKWNKEQFEKLNKKHDDEVKDLNRQKNLLYTSLVEAIKEYIISETKVSKKKAEKIYDYLYEEYHAYGLMESLRHLDRLLDLFR